jgi:hypothetical protein
MTRQGRYYKTVFYALLVSVVLVFVLLKSPGGPSQTFIAGDGLGYYAYLPATFIYDDHDYRFSWFNEVYKKYYGPGLFENPEDNFMVTVGDRRVNKYYQGLSFIWMPFFMGGHIFARSFGYDADGFSPPYQWSIGIASLFYLLTGLFFLRSLILKLFNDQLAAILVTASIIYGTHLYSFAFHVNSHTHAYSFTFLVLFFYFLVSLQKSINNRLYYLLSMVGALAVTVCIRPMNALVILTIPAFTGPGFFRGFFAEKFKGKHLVVLLALAFLFGYQFSIMWKQTGSLFEYTYTDERFYFARSRFFDALFSYHMGIFVYVPVIFFSFFGIAFLPLKKRIILPVFFMLVIYIYASWWFWPIVKRGMIDFYVIPAIFGGALISNMVSRTRQIILVSAFVMSMIYYQFKHYQVGVGALDEWLTTREAFWNNFFRVKRSHMYLVPSSSVIKEQACKEDFESSAPPGYRSREKQTQGVFSALLDKEHYITTVVECSYPEFFDNGELNRRVRIRFKSLFEHGVEELHFFLRFKDRNDKVLKEAPFYINKEQLIYDEWDTWEFGCQVEDNWFPVNTARNVDVVVWNVKSSGKLYIDEVRLDFFLTDNSFETLK